MSTPEQAAHLCLRLRAIIADRAGVSVADVHCDGSLGDQPLNLTSDQLKRLAQPFQDAAREVEGTVEISASETGKLDDVLSAYNLVGKKIGLKKLTCEDRPPVPKDGVAGIKAIRIALLALGAALCARTTLHAQSIEQSLWRSIEIRQNTDVKNYVAQNATFSIVAPDSGRTTYAANVGIIFDLLSRSMFTLSGTGDYSRNTIVEKEQNQWRAGLSGELLIGRIFGIEPVVRLDTKYAHDVKAGMTFAQSGLLLTATGRNHTGLPNTTIELQPCLPLTLVYSPYVGIEFDRKTSGPATTGTNFFRGVGRFDAVFRLGQPTRPAVELSMANAFRRDFQDEDVAGRRTSSFHQVSGTLFLGRGNRTLAGVSVSRTWGEDPTKGFARQAFTQLGLALRVSREAKQTGASYPPHQCSRRG